MVARLANFWVRRDHNPMIDYDDLESEGIIALLNSIYCYGGKPRKKKLPKFITYAHWGVYNRIMTKYLRSTPFSGLTSNGELMVQYEALKRELNRHVGFDEAVSIMELDEKQSEVLLRMLVIITNRCAMKTDEEGIDYVDLSKTFAGPSNSQFEIRGHKSGRPVYTQTELIEPDMLIAVEQTELSDWERSVFKAYLEGGNGWATQVASEHINPITGVQYSRAAPKVVLKRVKEKILDTYNGMREAAA